jgi:hypothetical protein
MPPPFTFDASSDFCQILREALSEALHLILWDSKHLRKDLLEKLGE